MEKEKGEERDRRPSFPTSNATTSHAILPPPSSPLSLSPPIEGTNLVYLSFLLSRFPVLLLHPRHQLCAPVRVHRLQPVQPGVDHVPAVGDHVQDH